MKAFPLGFGVLVVLLLVSSGFSAAIVPLLKAAVITGATDALISTAEVAGGGAVNAAFSLVSAAINHIGREIGAFDKSNSVASLEHLNEYDTPPNPSNSDISLFFESVDTVDPVVKKNVLSAWKHVNEAKRYKREAELLSDSGLVLDFNREKSNRLISTRS